MRNITKLFCMFILFLFTASFFVNTPGIPTSNSSGGSSTSNIKVAETKSVLADYPLNYTKVSWNQQIINDQREEQWNSSRYRFGPTLNWHTRNALTNEIIPWDQEIPIDTWFDFILEVPKTALGGQVPRAMIIMGNYYNLSEMDDGVMDVDFHPYAMAAIYYVPEDRFEIYSSKATINPSESPGPLPDNFTLSDVFGPMVEPFAELNMIDSDYVIGDESHWCRFRLLMNSTLHPGFYMFNALALDDYFQPIAESRSSQQSGRLLGIDLHSIVNEAFGGYFTVERKDENGDILYTVNRGDDFNITITSSNSTLLNNITIFMSAPSTIKAQRWVYGPYYESEVRTGAWQWNATYGTYIWNASIEVTWAEPKFGYHWEESYTWVDMGKEYLFFDPWANESYVHEAWPNYVICYDFVTSSWNYYAAYEFENNTWNGEEWEKTRWLGFEPWSLDWPIPYVLNVTSSNVFYNAKGKLVVNFRGHISEEMLPSGSEYGGTIHMRERVTNQYGRDLVNFVNLPIASPQDIMDYENQRELAIDSPVSVVKITHKGEPYSPSWIFQADPGEIFTVSSRLQGGIEYVDDIDGIAFVMYGYKESWGEFESIQWWQHSDIQIQVKINPIGEIDIKIYNYTVRTSWGYGTHYKWINVEIAPGIWQMQRLLIEDYFWQEQIWDFTLNEGAGGWTNQHFPMQSPRGEMPITCLLVGNVTYSIIGDDLKVSFDITTLYEMPPLEYWWDLFYGNLTWVTDYESGWGSHTVLGWTEDTVHHYYNGTQIVYVEKPYKAPIFHNMQTGDLYERNKIPYVIIAGKEVPLRSYIFGDKDHTFETLIREEYNYALEETRRFIKLYNGTELEVFGDQTAALYNITLADNTSFLSFQSDPYYMGGADIHYMIADDGSVIAMPWPIWSGYSSVRIGVERVTRVDYTYITYASPLYPYEPFNTEPLYIVGWPEYVGYDHWIMYLNGTWEPVDVWRCYEPGLEHLYMYFNPHVGRYFVFNWPWELMQCGGTYSGVFIPHYVTQLFAYITVEGSNYPIPAPGEPIWGWGDLDWIIRSKYVHEIAYIDKIGYVAEKLLDVWGNPYMEYSPGPPEEYWYNIYQVDVLGTLYNLTDWGIAPYHVLSYDRFPDHLPWVTKAGNMLFIPEVICSDWTVALGHRDPATLEFEVESWIDVITGYFDGEYPSSQIQNYNYTHPIGYEYVMTESGEEFFYNSTWRAVFHNITLVNGTYFYSAMDHPQIWPVDTAKWEIEVFYMIDIYGQYQWWTGWDEYTSQVIMISNVTGYPWDGSFGFLGEWINITSYEIQEWQWDGLSWYVSGSHYEDNAWAKYYYFLQAMNGTKYEIIPLHYTPESYRYNFPSWQFWDDGVWYNISGSSDMIYKAYQFEGYSQKLDYAPLPVSIIRAQDRIVVGSPDRGMWGIDIWNVNPENGALDLDGNLATVDDQYFVKEFHTSTDFYNITHEYLDVEIMWDPNSELYADEFHLHSFTGMVTFNWTFEWADYYIWTKAATGETLSVAEFDAIKDLLFDEWGNSKPGYWGISWLARNFTSADLIQQAIDNGWDWAIENTREWSWLWWELDESYSTEVGNETYSELMDINLAYQYAGMFAWQDENGDNFMDVSSGNLGDAEMTHYWMPVDVNSVTFVTPGEAYGNLNLTDTIYLRVNDTVDFGVTFDNVTGLVFPFGVYSYWDWFVGQYYGSDFINFNERPTLCMTDELSLAVHFSGIVNETGSNIAEVKFDITVGDWNLDTPGGQAVLEGMSLAVSFYSELSITSNSGNATGVYLDDYGQPLSNEIASPSSNFTMASGITSVALMSLGGAPYSWTKNASQVCTVDAQTVPLSAMSAIYVSGSGGTATTFSITSEQFYTLIGFKWWDGYALTVDPVFVGYISHGSSDTTAPSISGISHSAIQISGDDYVRIETTVTDSGGSNLAEVRVWDIDNNINHSMSYDSGLGKYVAEIERSEDGRYTFNYRIAAIDNAGNEAVSASNAFLFRDNIAPAINTLSWDNDTDGLGNEIAIVSVTVSDTGGSGIDDVILTYSDAMGDHDVTMTLEVSIYEGTIPNHAPMTIVSFWVTVTDVDGNSIQSSINEFTFSAGGGPDIYGPSLSLISHDPENPTPTSVVTVSANIQDLAGVDYATLQYSINSGEWVNVTMTPSGNIYSGIIPAQINGTVVSYRIVAADNLGNVIVSGVFFYTVLETTTTTTTTSTTTTETSTGLLSGDTLLLIIAGVGALVVVVIVLGLIRKRT